MFRWFFPFTVSLFLTRAVIRTSKRLNKYQPISSAVNHSHKTNTPSMGGIAIFASFMLTHLISSLLGLNRGREHIYYVYSICFILGIADDVRKISMQNNKGLRKLSKFVILSAALLIYFLINRYDISTSIVNSIIIIVSAAAADILDGLDGLLGTAAIISLVALGSGPCIVLAGSILGFLNYNIKPARIFMGDGGAMMIGGFIGCALIDKPSYWWALFMVPIVNLAAVGLKLLLVKLKLNHSFFKAPLHHFLEDKIGESGAVASILTVHAITTIAVYLVIKGMSSHY